MKCLTALGSHCPFFFSSLGIVKERRGKIKLPVKLTQNCCALLQMRNGRIRVAQLQKRIAEYSLDHSLFFAISDCSGMFCCFLAYRQSSFRLVVFEIAFRQLAVTFCLRLICSDLVRY